MKDNIGVHRTHCCVLHGCKYGEDEVCPVVQKVVIQDYLCECCSMDAYTSVNELFEFQEKHKKCEEFQNLKEIEDHKILKDYKYCPCCGEKL